MVEYVVASPDYIPACAELYQEAFSEALQAMFDSPRIDSCIIQDIFQIYNLSPLPY